MSEPPDALEETLRRLSGELSELAEDWWLIGSSALVARGATVAKVADVDVLTTSAGAAWLAQRWGCAPTSPEPHQRFRSDVFLRWVEPPLPVEVMAGFHVSTAGGWRRVWPRTRVAVSWRGATYYTPSRTELLELLELFDRPKDHERAAALRALPDGP